MKVNTELGEVELADDLVRLLRPQAGLVSGRMTAYSEVERIIRCAMQDEAANLNSGKRVARRVAISTIAAQSIAMMTRDYDLSLVAEVNPN